MNLDTVTNVAESTTSTVNDITVFGMDIKVVVSVLVILVFVLIIALISNTYKMNVMKQKYQALMSGKKGADLEKIIRVRFREMDQVKANAKRVTREHKQMRANVSHTLSRYGLIKYNAFEDVTGKMSFVLALLDENGNGIVLNSMHSRDNCYNYAKEIIKGESFIPLTKEEQQAIDQAKTIDDEINAMKAQEDADDFLNYVDENDKLYINEPPAREGISFEEYFAKENAKKYVDQDGNSYYKDIEGNIFYEDAEGNKYIKDTDGKIYYQSADGKTFYDGMVADEDGNLYYVDRDTENEENENHENDNFLQ